MRSYICENCGREYASDHELISLNGENFCSNCSDEFHFIFDEYAGYVALREAAQQKKFPKDYKIFLDIS